MNRLPWPPPKRWHTVTGQSLPWVAVLLAVVLTPLIFGMIDLYERHHARDTAARAANAAARAITLDVQPAQWLTNAPQITLPPAPTRIGSLCIWRFASATHCAAYRIIFEELSGAPWWTTSQIERVMHTAVVERCSDASGTPTGSSCVQVQLRVPLPSVSVLPWLPPTEEVVGRAVIR